jgi:hypothetical protein
LQRGSMKKSMFQPLTKRTVMITGLIPAAMFARTASADLIGPGDLASDFATTLAARPDLGGDIEAKLFIPYTLKDSDGKDFYTGHILHEVVRNPQNNTLSFYYRFMNESDDVLGVTDAIVSDFGNYKTDVEVLTDSSGETAPTDIYRSFDGKDVYFAFDETAPRISTGGNSYTFLVQTDATQYDSKGDIDIQAFTAQSKAEDSKVLDSGEAIVSTFRPIGNAAKPASPPNPPNPPATVPLPSPFVAGAITMIATGLYMRRLRRPASQQ